MLEFLIFGIIVLLFIYLYNEIKIDKQKSLSNLRDNELSIIGKDIDRLYQELDEMYEKVYYHHESNTLFTLNDCEEIGKL